jgi:hypothetical protein
LVADSTEYTLGLTILWVKFEAKNASQLGVHYFKYVTEFADFTETNLINEGDFIEVNVEYPLEN